MSCLKRKVLSVWRMHKSSDDASVWNVAIRFKTPIPFPPGAKHPSIGRILVFVQFCCYHERRLHASTGRSGEVIREMIDLAWLCGRRLLDPFVPWTTYGCQRQEEGEEAVHTRKEEEGEVPRHQQEEVEVEPRLRLAEEEEEEEEGRPQQEAVVVVVVDHRQGGREAAAVARH